MNRNDLIFGTMLVVVVISILNASLFAFLTPATKTETGRLFVFVFLMSGIFVYGFVGLGYLFGLGVLLRTTDLDTGKFSYYEVLPLLPSLTYSECDSILRIKEGNARIRYYILEDRKFRDGLKAIPRDGTPFKLVRGNGPNDLVVVKL